MYLPAKVFRSRMSLCWTPSDASYVRALGTWNEEAETEVDLDSCCDPWLETTDQGRFLFWSPAVSFLSRFKL